MEKVDNPDLFTPVKLEYLAKIKADHICILEKVRYWLWFISTMLLLLLLLLMMLSLVITSTASPTKETGKDVIKSNILVLWAIITTSFPIALFVLFYFFLALLIVDPSLVLVLQRLVSIGDLLKLLFCTLWVVLILVWMVLHGKLLERLLDVCLRGVPSNTHNFIVIFATIFGFLLTTVLGLYED